MTHAEHTRSRPRRGKRRLLAALLVAAGMLLASLPRWCGLGLGPGTGEDQSAIDAAPRILSPIPGDAGLGTRDAARPAAPCQVSLSSRGLAVDGVSATIEQAVATCRHAGRAELEVTGGARTGTYRELVDALEQAGIPFKDNLRQRQP